jgi:hypothetical protein
MVGRFFGKKPPVDEVPVCPVHHTPMVLRAKLGKPVRFTNQETQSYKLIFRCALSTCNETKEVEKVRSEIPVPGETPARPSWAKWS